MMLPSVLFWVSTFLQVGKVCIGAKWYIKPVNVLFLQHEVTWSISTPLWMGCQSIAGLLPSINFASAQLIYLCPCMERGFQGQDDDSKFETLENSDFSSWTFFGVNSHPQTTFLEFQYLTSYLRLKTCLLCCGLPCSGYRRFLFTIFASLASQADHSMCSCSRREYSFLNMIGVKLSNLRNSRNAGRFKSTNQRFAYSGSPLRFARRSNPPEETKR